MNTESKIDDKLDSLLKHKGTGGFTKPSSDYFEHFADKLPIEKEKRVKTVSLSSLNNNWVKIGSLVAAAMVLLALWIFVFDANVKSDTDLGFTVEELMALNDFQNYNEDLIYSEMASVYDEDILTVDEEMDALLELEGISTDEILKLYSTEY